MSSLVALSEIVRNLGLAAAALVGLWLAWRKLTPERTQADLARRAHVVELFNRAVGQLSDERLEVRLGAIYVLRDISLGFPDLAEPVVELLQIHLRERTTGYSDNPPPVDVQAIVATLRMRIISDEKPPDL